MLWLSAQRGRFYLDQCLFQSSKVMRETSQTVQLTNLRNILRNKSAKGVHLKTNKQKAIISGERLKKTKQELNFRFARYKGNQSPKFNN